MQILYFTAEWCQPCAKFKPVVEAEAQARGIKVKYVDIDSPEGFAKASAVGIQSVPTLILQNGESETRLGAVPAAKLRAALDEL